MYGSSLRCKKQTSALLGIKTLIDHYIFILFLLIIQHIMMVRIIIRTSVYESNISEYLFVVELYFKKQRNNDLTGFLKKFHVTPTGSIIQRSDHILGGSWERISMF